MAEAGKQASTPRTQPVPSLLSPLCPALRKQAELEGETAGVGRAGAARHVACLCEGHTVSLSLGWAGLPGSVLRRIPAIPEIVPQSSPAEEAGLRPPS